MTRNLLGGLAVAVAISTPFVVPTIAGISTWKYVLGVIGVALFVRAGMGRPPSKH